MENADIYSLWLNTVLLEVPPVVSRQTEQDNTANSEALPSYDQFKPKLTSSPKVPQPCDPYEFTTSPPTK